ncbi:MAG: TetR/AcrR family transcriptional regulator [Lysobacter sp.]
MARKPSTNPRKHASQERSRATVDTLVEATARILVSEGYDHASTNRIAEKAGVSIGSLYQYFPGKDALVAAVIDRHKEDVMHIVRGTLAEVDTLPVEAAVRRLVTVAIDAHRVDPELHRVLTEQLPRTGRLEQMEGFQREAQANFAAYLARHRDELRTLDVELAAFVCFMSIEAITHGAVLYRPDLLKKTAVGKLVDEATRLVVAYLQPERDGTRPWLHS